MNETHSLLTDTSNLLNDIEPVLRKFIGSLVHDLNPHTGILKELIQEEIENYEVLRTRIHDTNERIDVLLNPDQDFTPPDGPLCVTMDNGEKIHLRYAADTFVEVIEKLGIEQVWQLGLKHGRYPLIDKTCEHIYTTRQSGDYYIIVHTSTMQKKLLLEQIAQQLKVSLKVEIIET